MTQAPKLVPGFGPNPARIALVGEAPGLNEAIYRKPFIGQAGQELTRIIAEAGLDRSTMYVTNVFKTRPDDNNVELFFTTKSDPAACLDLPPLKRGSKSLFLHSEFRPQFDALVPELVGVGAEIVVALGGTALWALLGFSKITAYVGTLHVSTPDRPFAVIPTYHPAAILRAWNLRTTAVANFIKVRGELDKRRQTSGPNPTPTNKSSLPQVQTNPTLDDVILFCRRAHKAPLLAVDVETAHGQIRTVGFALEPNRAFVVPFWEPPGPSYWPDLESEKRAWNAVRHALAGPGTKVFHNGAYDIQYLWRVHGIPIAGPIEDTLLLHHALEPELKKDLGTLAATYLEIPEWKTMRAKSEKEEE